MKSVYQDITNAIEDEGNDLVSFKVREEDGYDVLLIKCHGVFSFPGCGESSKSIEDFWKVFSSAESIDIFTNSNNDVCIELMINGGIFE